MNTEYKDILDRIPDQPGWFDEHAVPRFEPFDPKHIADIYADECVLFEIRCQGCDRPFAVVMSDSERSRMMRSGFCDSKVAEAVVNHRTGCAPCRSCPTLEKAVRAGLETSSKSIGQLVKDGDLHYGDPPNISCCPAGPTMNSIPRRVLQYWHRSRDTGYDWKRNKSFEVQLDAAWANDEPFD